MRRPEIKIGDFICRYKQVPYEDRYFFVYFKGREVAKIPLYLEEYNLAYRLMELDKDGYQDKWYNFLERVRKYNEYLDSKND